MTVSIKQHFSHAPTQEEIEFKRITAAILTDLTALRAEQAALLAKMDTDFTAQNAAVTSSQLDVDYNAVAASTAELVE